MCGETQVSTTNLRIAMNKLGKVDLDTGLNGYEQQHKVCAIPCMSLAIYQVHKNH